MKPLLPRRASHDNDKKTVIPRTKFKPLRLFLSTHIHPNLPRRRNIPILLFLLYLLLTTDSFLLNWIFWTLFGGPKPADQLISQNCRPPDYSLPFAVVVPLIANQLPRLKWTLSRWGDPRYTPCGNPPQHLPTLFFFFDRPLTHTPVAEAITAIRTHIQTGTAASPIARCFASVQYRSANLSETATTNSYTLDPLRNLVHTAGSNAQWEAAFEMLKHQYRHMFYMEPDTWPIRPGWLSAAIAESTYGPFWMRGTTMRYPPKFNIALEPFRTRYQRHLNGNAIYLLGDPCFERYRYLTKQAYGNAAFDVAMTHFRLALDRIMTFQQVAHRFQATEFVVDIGVTPFDMNKLLYRFPRTFLVHGKRMHVKHPALNFMQYR